MKTTRCDIAQVLFYLKNQPSTVVRCVDEARTDLQHKQAKYVHNYEAGFISKGDLGEGGKPLPGFAKYSSTPVNAVHNYVAWLFSCF